MLLHSPAKYQAPFYLERRTAMFFTAPCIQDEVTEICCWMQRWQRIQIGLQTLQVQLPLSSLKASQQLADMKSVTSASHSPTVCSGQLSLLPSTGHAPPRIQQQPLPIL